MFVQISPSEHDLGETFSSLNFASRVRGVELGPAKRQIDTGELQKMKTMVSLCPIGECKVLYLLLYGTKFLPISHELPEA